MRKLDEEFRELFRMMGEDGIRWSEIAERFTNLVFVLVDNQLLEYRTAQKFKALMHNVYGDPLVELDQNGAHKLISDDEVEDVLNLTDLMQWMVREFKNDRYFRTSLLDDKPRLSEILDVLHKVMLKEACSKQFEAEDLLCARKNFIYLEMENNQVGSIKICKMNEAPNAGKAICRVKAGERLFYCKQSRELIFQMIDSTFAVLKWRRSGYEILLYPGKLLDVSDKGYIVAQTNEKNELRIYPSKQRHRNYDVRLSPGVISFDGSDYMRWYTYRYDALALNAGKLSYETGKLEQDSWAEAEYIWKCIVDTDFTITIDYSNYISHRVFYDGLYDPPYPLNAQNIDKKLRWIDQYAKRGYIHCRDEERLNKLTDIVKSMKREKKQDIDMVATLVTDEYFRWNHFENYDEMVDKEVYEKNHLSDIELETFAHMFKLEGDYYDTNFD